MTGEAAILSHWIAAGSYAFLALFILVLVQRTLVPVWLGAAAALHAMWAAALAHGLGSGNGLALSLSLGETVRSAAWLGLLGLLLRLRWRDSSADPSSAAVLVIAVLVALQLGIDVAAASGVALAQPVLQGSDLVRVAMAIGGLALTHNLYISSAPSDRWSLGILCIALAGLFAYDVNLFTFQLLEPVLARTFFEARGFANAVLVPLFLLAALRNRALNFSLSRQAAFQTFTLGAIGIYLVLMSLAAYLLGVFGGDWGLLLRITFIFAALVFGFVVLLSGSARAWVRVKINKHFFAYKYDYREEWLRFIAKIARSGPGFGSLSQRVIEAIASLVDSPSGALFHREGERTFVPASRWNMPRSVVAPIELGREDLRAMTESQRILDVGGAGGGGNILPASMREEGHPWLLVPLAHLDDVPALVLLERSRVARDLDWEDFDILRIVGRQAGSLVAEERALADLAESRKFEEFNRRFAFIMHDIKNIVSQLSLLARNAERHADNPEFRADMAATLEGSVGKMKDLLARLGRESDRGRTDETFDLQALARRLCDERARLGDRVVLDAEDYAMPLEGDAAKIEQALGHLIQNAIDASTDATPVRLRLRNEAGAIKIIVEDRGQGMSDVFIAEELFKPFRSTKDAGFGIGAYEAREIVRASGGRMEVSSALGEGTRFVISFPAGPAEAAPERAGAA